MADARTWRVTVDGTGDAPSIEAAMDSTAVGDTVLVARGEHVIEQVSVANGIVLMGEEGALQTRLVPYPHPAVLSGLSCGLLPATTIVTGLWFDGFRSGAGYGAINAEGALEVVGCLFTNNEFGIVVATDYGGPWIESNTFVDNTFAIDVRFGPGRCWNNIIWDPTQGLERFVAVCNDILRLEDIQPLLRPANFSLDPQFCGEKDYRLMASSPCAPGNTPIGNDCNLIGALPVNCSPTAVEERTWGQIKALYWKQR